MPKCKGCDAEIIWVKTQKGKSTPLDQKEITIYVTGTQSIVKGHQSHWATCPKAESFKKKAKEIVFYNGEPHEI